MKKLKFKKYSKIFFSIVAISCISAGFFSAILKIEAANATATLTVNNSVPTASGVHVYYSHDAGSTYTDGTSGNTTMASNATTKIKITFTATDNNGCEDIDSAATKTAARFYRTDETSGCTLNSANCYTTASFVCTQDASSCTAGGADLDATYTCTTDVQFYTDATDAGSPNAATNWTAAGVPADNAGSASQATATTEIVTLTSLSVTASITYGSLALGGDTGASNQTTSVTNKGNVPIDTQVGGYGAGTGDGYSMHCTVGNVSVAKEEYSVGAFTYASSPSPPAYALVTNSTPNTISNNIASGAASSATVYWGMGLPANGVGGSCSGTVVFTAVLHS
jgi:hypothetical protein